MDNLSSCKTSTIISVEEHKNSYQIVADKFIECCLSLDVSIFEPYMKEEDIFEEEDKYTFLSNRKKQFAKIRAKAEEDFTVSLSHTNCNGCSRNKPITRFEVLSNKTKQVVTEFGFLIDINNGVLKDIYQCYIYKPCESK